MCSSWARAPFRRTPAITRPTPWGRSPIGRRMRFATVISRARGPWSMRDLTRTLTSVSAAFLLAACAPRPPADAAQGAHASPQNFAQTERGRYLAIAGDCVACHGDPSGSGDLSGGRAISTPFGTLLAPNITPDRATGIGG